VSVKQAARGLFLNGPSKSIIDLPKQQGLTPTHILRIPLDWKGGFGGLVTYSRKERCEKDRNFLFGLAANLS